MMGKYFRLVECDCSCCVDGHSSIIISGRVDMTSAARVHMYLPDWNSTDFHYDD